VDPIDFKEFLVIIPEPEVAVMIEAKMKDLAVFKLRKALDCDCWSQSGGREPILRLVLSCRNIPAGFQNI
jgi:hypothetical protein